MFDGKAFGAEIVGVVKDYMERSLAPVMARVEAIERRVSELKMPDPFDAAELQEDIATLRNAIDALPFPKDGKDGRDGIDGKDGAPGERGEKGEPGDRGEPGLHGKDGADGRDGRDGLDAVEFLRGADGHLVVTLSNGTTRDLGEINGKDGAPGLNGKDGADGVGFDDLDLIETETGFVLRFIKGEVVKEFRLPIPLYRGVWKEGGTYRRGDGVTWGGALWIVEDDETADKPDGGKGWRLAVKKGRDGKDGVVRTVPEKPVVKV